MADLAPHRQEQPPPSSAPSGADGQHARTLHWRRRIFAVTWLTYAGFYFVRQAFSVAKLGILDDPLVNHALTKHALGVIDAVYLAAYAAGQFCWGSLADRFGPRVVVLTGMVAAIGGACLMGLSGTLLVFGGAMVVQGLAQSAGWAPLCKNMGNFFPVAQRGRILGLWSTNYAFGGLAAPPFLGWIAYSLFGSWRAAFFGGAVTLAVVLALFALFQRNSPRDAGLEEPAPDAAPGPGSDGSADAGPATGPGEPDGDPGTDRDGTGAAAAEPARGGLALYRETLQDRMVVALGLCYFLLKPARYAILLWGPVLVSQRLPDVGKVGDTLIPIAFGVTGVVAPIAVGWVSDRVFGSRRAPAAVVSLGVLAVILALFMPLTATGSAAVMIGVLALIGLAVYAADSMISCVAAVDFGTDRGAGTATGLVNGCGSVGAILGGLLPGFLSGTVLFAGFAGAALLAGLVMLPHWNRVPRGGAAAA